MLAPDLKLPAELPGLGSDDVPVAGCCSPPTTARPWSAPTASAPWSRRTAPTSAGKPMRGAPMQRVGALSLGWEGAEAVCEVPEAAARGGSKRAIEGAESPPGRAAAVPAPPSLLSW